MKEGGRGVRTIGDLKERVTVQKRRAVTEGGISRNEWVAVGTWWAEVMHLSQKDWSAASATYTQEIITVHLWTPLQGTLDTGARILWRGRAFAAAEVIPDKPIPGMTEIRAIGVEMEGEGYA